MTRLVSAVDPARTIPISMPECTVGRSAECDVALPDQRVSRKHARFVRGYDGLRLEDLGSANGTFVNRQRLTGVAPIANGDEIQFGTARFIVDTGDDEAPHFDGRRTIIEIPRVPDDLLEVAAFRHHERLSAPALLAPVDSSVLVDRLRTKLRTVYRFAEVLATALEPHVLLDRVLEEMLVMFPPALSAVALVRTNDEGTNVHPVASRHRHGASHAGPIALSPRMLARVLGDRQAVLLRPNTQRMSMTEVVTLESQRGHRMAAPLAHDGHALGLLLLDSGGDENAFDQIDLDMLGGIAAQSALALSLAEAHQQRSLRERLEKDLVIARQIQRTLLPSSAPSLTGIEFGVHYEPAFQVGGDFYDFPWLDGTHLALVIGDVSGKAISGALFMSRVTSEVRAHVRAAGSASALLRMVNDAIAPLTDDGMFCTALVVALDLDDHTVRIANAGHTVPLLQRHGVVTVLDDDATRTVPLGIEAEIHPGEIEAKLQPGDVMLLYTDGLLEARGADGTFYGEERLHTTFGRARGSASEIIALVLADIERFAGGTAQSDDQTIVCVRVTGARSRVPTGERLAAV